MPPEGDFLEWTQSSGGGQYRARPRSCRPDGDTSDRYVGYALRLQREAPELFQRVWSGQMTMPAALRGLTGGAVPELTQAVEAYRRRLNRALRNRQHAPALLARLNTVLDEFERELAGEEEEDEWGPGALVCAVQQGQWGLGIYS